MMVRKDEPLLAGRPSWWSVIVGVRRCGWWWRQRRRLKPAWSLCMSEGVSQGGLLGVSQPTRGGGGSISSRGKRARPR